MSLFPNDDNTSIYGKNNIIPNHINSSLNVIFGNISEDGAGNESAIIELGAEKDMEQEKVEFFHFVVLGVIGTATNIVGKSILE